MIRAVSSIALIAITIALPGMAAAEAPTEEEKRECSLKPRPSGDVRRGDLIAMVAAITSPAPPATTSEDESAEASTELDCTEFRTLAAEHRNACITKTWDAAAVRPCQRLAIAATEAYVKLLPEALQTTAAALNDAARSRAIATHRCAFAGTLCLNRAGEPLVEPLPVRVNERLHVVVLSPFVDDADAVKVTLRSVAAIDTLTKSTPKDSIATHATDTRLEWFVVGEVTSDPVAETTATIEVQFTGPDDKVRTEIVDVTHGKYFVDFGISVPLLLGGLPDVQADGVVAYTQTLEPRLAFSAVLFPFGRRKNQIAWNGARGVGIQLGTDFDFTRDVRERDYHVGVAWYVVAGVGLGVGVSAVQGEFLAELAGPDPAEGELPIERRYVLRPYVSIFLTTEFIDVARGSKPATGD